MQLGPSAYALLGFLAYGEASGYDLKRLADETVSKFWAAADSQIYPALGRLEEAGFVRSRKARGGGHPQRVVYRITRAGERALDEWLRQPAAAPTYRHPAAIRLFFGWRLDDRDLAVLINRRRHELSTELAELYEKRQSLDVRLRALAPGDPIGRGLRFGRLVLRGGIEMAEGELRWWDSVAGELSVERATG